MLHKKFLAFGSLFGLVVGVMLLVVNPSSIDAQLSCPSGKAWTKWNPISTISYYNIYYRQADEKSWTHSVPRVDASSTAYEITCLKTNVTYYYTVSAVAVDGSERFINEERVLRYGGGSAPTTPYWTPAPTYEQGVGTGRG